MRKILTSAMAGVLAAGAVLATAGAANADSRRYRNHHRGGGNAAVAAAVIGGVAGLALGAALSNNGDRRHGYYDDGRYYDRGYYDRAPPRHRYNSRADRHYGDGYGRAYGGYRTCVTRDRVYDPYIGRRVRIRDCY